MKRPVSVLLLVAVWMAVDAGLSTAQPAETARLTILHTNDTHGRLLPFSYPSVSASGSPVGEMPVRGNIGGAARRATLVSRIRAELKPRGVPVWLIDAGDFCDGTPFSTEYLGEADVAAMNAIGYDFATLGNHDFNLPLSQAKKLIGLAAYPILTSNVTERATGRTLTRPYLVEKVGPVRVGVFGLVTRETATYRAVQEGLEVADEIETARRIVAELRPRTDIIVLISHAGEQMDLRLAAEVEGLDVIVGGHSHSRLPSGQFVWRSEDLSADGDIGTVIVQAHQWAGELGRLDLLFERRARGEWRVARHRSRLIPVSADIPEDGKVAAVVDRFWSPIARKFGEVLGRAADDFSSRGDDHAEYHLVADAVRETFGTDIEFENSGGVRSPIVAGPITQADAIAVDPFGNTVVTFRVTGRQIREILRRSAPYVSGLRYRMVNGELIEVSVGGKPLEDDRVYTAASNSYFAGRSLKGITVQDTGRTRLEVLVEYIRSKGTVTPLYDGRRVVIGRPAVSPQGPVHDPRSTDQPGGWSRPLSELEVGTNARRPGAVVDEPRGRRVLERHTDRLEQRDVKVDGRLPDRTDGAHCRAGCL